LKVDNRVLKVDSLQRIKQEIRHPGGPFLRGPEP